MVYKLLEQLGFAWFDPYETHIPGGDISLID
jgi:hypothetical protein